MVPDVSPRGSFKGWVFGTWLAKNKAYVKTVLSGYLAFVSVFGIAGAPEHLIEIGGATLLAVLLIAARLLLDAVDFLASDVDLPG